MGNSKDKYNLHFRRLEFKYILPTVLADALVPTVTRYMDLDKHAGEDGHYTVKSLYFDSPHLLCYQQKLDGIYFRKKYRIRSYEEPKRTFFEIKRKAGDVIIKDRATLSSNDDLLVQEFESESLIRGIEDGVFRSELLSDYLNHSLSPKLMTIYKRKPYVSRFSNNLRLTFDYDLKACFFKNGRIDFKNRSCFIDNSLTVLEIKFNSKIPSWLGFIIKAHSLERSSFSKYAASIYKLRQN